MEGELTQICTSILTLLDNNLIPSATTGESKVRTRRCTTGVCGVSARLAQRGALVVYAWPRSSLFWSLFVLTGPASLWQVFYLKMKGDYHRYLAEFKTGTDRKEAAENTLAAYKAAQVGVPHSYPQLPPDSPTTPPCHHTRTSRCRTWRPRIPFASDWHSTSRSSTTRS